MEQDIIYKDYKVHGPYTRKDGRQHCVLIKHNEKNQVIERKTISYPRILMAEKLGRLLEPYEDVHHIDGDATNNSVSNLQVIDHIEHERNHATKYNYVDKEAVCDVCGNKFVWTSKRQQRYYKDVSHGDKRIITCSKSCSSFYGRQEQLGRNS